MSEQKKQIDWLAAGLGFLDARRAAKKERQGEKQAGRERRARRREAAALAQREKKERRLAARAAAGGAGAKTGAAAALRAAKGVWGIAEGGACACKGAFAASAREWRLNAVFLLVCALCAWMALGLNLACRDPWLWARSDSASFKAMAAAGAAKSQEPWEKLRGERVGDSAQNWGVEFRAAPGTTWIAASREEAASASGLAALTACLREKSCVATPPAGVGEAMLWVAGRPPSFAADLPDSARNAWRWGARLLSAETLAWSALEGLALGLCVMAPWLANIFGLPRNSLRRAAKAFATAQNALISCAYVAGVGALVAVVFAGMCASPDLAPAKAAQARELLTRPASTDAERAVAWSWGGAPGWTTEKGNEKAFAECQRQGFCGSRSQVRAKAAQSGLKLDAALSVSRSDWGFLFGPVGAVILMLVAGLGSVGSLLAEPVDADDWEKKLKKWAEKGAQKAERQRILSAMPPSPEPGSPSATRPSAKRL